MILSNMSLARRVLVTFGATLLLAAAAVGVACAQPPTQTEGQSPQPQAPARPFRGLFGGVERDPDVGNVLYFTFSGYSGYDDNVVEAGGSSSGIDPLSRVSGSLSGVEGRLRFMHRGRRLTFTTDGGSVVRTYRRGESFTDASHSLNMDLSGSLGPRASFNLTQLASYSPYYSFGAVPGAAEVLTPGQVANSRPDYALYRVSVTTFITEAGLTRNLTRHSSLAFKYESLYADYGHMGSPLRDQSGTVRLGRAASRGADVDVGYTYRVGELGGPSVVSQLVRSHGLNFGFSRRLGRRQRTAVGLHAGGSAILLEPGNDYRTTAAVFLTRSIGRTWNLRVDGERGFRLLEGFAQPLFTSSVNATAAGYLGRRLDLRVLAGFTDATVGLGSVGQGLRSYLSNLVARYAVSANVAVFVDGQYYYYLFSGGLPLPSGVPSGLNRTGVRAGITLWLPLLR